MNRTVRALAAWTSLLCMACASAPVRDLAPGEKPPIDSDEAGLWMMMDKIEANLNSSGRLETDPELNRTVRGILCRLAPEQCADIRVYIVSTPHFNATMAPNGSMQVWTGLMLRAQNEDQLAFVIGHELGHFQKRHALTRWRTARDTSGVMAFLTIIAAGAGVGFVGPLAQLAALSAIYAYSRDQEREADEVGFRLMARAGYDPGEAARIWKNLVAEREAYRKPDEVVFFATHPSPPERIETLEKLAGQVPPPAAAAKPDRSRYAERIAPFRAAWLQEELRKGEYAATLVMLEQLSAAGAAPAELEYFRAEVFRLRDAEGDAPKAAAAYERAIALGGAPAAAHRSLGLVYRKRGDTVRARACFEAYLKQAPDAGDAKMITRYLEEMK